MDQDREAAILTRPRPPASLLSIDGASDLLSFVPAPDLTEWLEATFIADGAPLENPDHAHLRYAKLACVWTSVENARHGRRIVGQAEMAKNAGGIGKWSRARAEQQIVEWFGCVPDFLLTFDAAYADSCSDASFMALCEHELMHAGQERDEWGSPRFSKATGAPVFCLRGHDVETFVGIAQRYGAIESGMNQLMEALSKPPSIAQAEIDFVCGTCLK